MDILSARKKAAARAKTKKKESDANSVPVPAGEPPKPPAGPADVEAKVPAPPAEEPATVSIPDSAEGSGETPAEDLEMLAFRLGGEEYVVMVEQVKEVLKIRELTPVPHAPEHVLGVTSLRGTVLPVIDLCKRLGLAPGVRDEKTRIVVVSLDDEKTGLVVDRVSGVLRLTPDAVRPAPETVGQGAGAEFLRGIARKDDKLYILLDLEKAVGS